MYESQQQLEMFEVGFPIGNCPDQGLDTNPCTIFNTYFLSNHKVLTTLQSILIIIIQSVFI